MKCYNNEISKKRDILRIHMILEKDYGFDSTILLPGNLELALESPKRILFGTIIFPTLYEKAAALMSNMIKLHPFLHGNKRTGLLATITFLERNGRTLRRDFDEEVDISVKTATCTVNLDQLVNWIKLYSRRKF